MASHPRRVATTPVWWEAVGLLPSLGIAPYADSPSHGITSCVGWTKVWTKGFVDTWDVDMNKRTDYWREKKREQRMRAKGESPVTPQCDILPQKAPRARVSTARRKGERLP